MKIIFRVRENEVEINRVIDLSDSRKIRYLHVEEVEGRPGMVRLFGDGDDYTIAQSQFLDRLRCGRYLLCEIKIYDIKPKKLTPPAKLKDAYLDAQYAIVSLRAVGRAIADKDHEFMNRANKLEDALMYLKEHVDDTYNWRCA